jgi:hypothetical protein
LPKAAMPAAPTVATTATARHGKTPPATKPVRGATTSRPNGAGTSPTPSPSSTTGYGIFE